MKKELADQLVSPKAKPQIKYRGPLTKQQVSQLISFLAKKGRLLRREYEKALYFESTAFPSIGDFKWGTARVSLKAGSRGPYLRIKEGNPADHARDEYKIKIQKTDLPNLLYILFRLGLHEAFYRPAFRRVFRYGNLSISIKTQCVMGNHFEIEVSTAAKHALVEIKNFCAKFKLHIWTEKEYKERITRLMKTAPAINILTSKLLE